MQRDGQSQKQTSGLKESIIVITLCFLSLNLHLNYPSSVLTCLGQATFLAPFWEPFQPRTSPGHRGENYKTLHL